MIVRYAYNKMIIYRSFRRSV